jgi:hypothetical protein
MNLKILALIKKIPKSVFLGVLDALLPNIKDSIKEKPSYFIQEKPGLLIDWPRLTAAFVAFTVIVLSILDLIKVEDLINFFKIWNF